MTELEAAKLLVFLAAAYPGTPRSDETVTLFTEQFVSWPFDVAARAAAEIIQTDERWPSIARLRAVCADVARRRAPARELGPAPAGPCARCGGTGWETTDPERNVVARCRCTQGRRVARANDQGTEHRQGCTCGRCHWGPGREATVHATSEPAPDLDPDAFRGALEAAREALRASRSEGEPITPYAEPPLSPQERPREPETGDLLLGPARRLHGLPTLT